MTDYTAEEQQTIRRAHATLQRARELRRSADAMIRNIRGTTTKSCRPRTAAAV